MQAREESHKSKIKEKEEEGEEGRDERVENGCGEGREQSRRSRAEQRVTGRKEELEPWYSTV